MLVCTDLLDNIESIMSIEGEKAKGITLYISA
jgi:hypothetical protein